MQLLCKFKIKIELPCDPAIQHLGFMQNWKQNLKQIRHPTHNILYSNIQNSQEVWIA